MNTRKIHCCGCDGEVNARLTDGKEIYPHRGDLYSLKFWKCDTCGNHVGCHRNGKKAKPLGVIATPEIKQLRMQIHRKLDPIWQQGAISRKSLYEALTQHMGFKYHTADIKTEEDAKKVLAKLEYLEQWAVKNRGFKIGDRA
ncbi:zinc-finger-containing protein [Psychrobacter pygoscelis]|uniref:zinc-finger-containing protein n=1 Tax=Psychrobacter pygoscelis TaxID=2488563 RepID=UPI00103DF3DE|nr:zinc-finger-containing protein [Psychrobacter pygoscelis]